MEMGRGISRAMASITGMTRRSSSSRDDRIGKGAGGFAAHVQDIGPGRDQGPGLGQGVVMVKKAAAVGRRSRG